MFVYVICRYGEIYNGSRTPKFARRVTCCEPVTCLCIYIYIYMYIYIYIYVCIYVYIYICVYVYKCNRINTGIFV